MGTGSMVLGRRQLLGIAIGGLGLALLVTAAYSDDFEDCSSTDAQRSIDGCSAIIERGNEKAKTVAIAYSNRGKAYYGKGEYDRAIKDYDRAIELDPKYASTFHNRGLAYNAKGESLPRNSIALAMLRTNDLRSQV